MLINMKDATVLRQKLLLNRNKITEISIANTVPPELKARKALLLVKTV
jgi:hypothetical protein